MKLRFISSTTVADPIVTIEGLKDSTKDLLKALRNKIETINAGEYDAGKKHIAVLNVSTIMKPTPLKTSVAHDNAYRLFKKLCEPTYKSPNTYLQQGFAKLVSEGKFTEANFIDAAEDIKTCARAVGMNIENKYSRNTNSAERG